MSTDTKFTPEEQKWIDDWSVWQERVVDGTPTFGLGLMTRTTDSDRPNGLRPIEVRYQQPAVNNGNNLLTLAVLTTMLKGKGEEPLAPGTHELSMDRINYALNQFPSSFVKSATRTNHGNIFALQQLQRRLMRLQSGAFGERFTAVLHISDDLMAPIETIPEAWLRLMLCSTRKTIPCREVSPDGLFGTLETLMWYKGGAYTVDEFCELRDEIWAETGETIQPDGGSDADKFPRMSSYVALPDTVRVANGNRIRLGAYLSDGTTVMHEGFFNTFTASLGPGMFEGRVSHKVLVGAHSDIGGGASIQGTLSGGGNIVVSVGEGCLLEANSGLGVPVGDRSRIEAGTYIKSTTPVSVTGNRDLWAGVSQTSRKLQDLIVDRRGGDPVKAIELAGISDAVFRRNALSGAVEVVPRGNTEWGGLNDLLHKTKVAA